MADYFFAHRAAAAFFALSDRCFAVIFAARAFPPLSPPFRPSATAAGSFPSGGGAGFSTSVSPVTASTMEMAVRFGSGSRCLRERFGIRSRLADPPGVGKQSPCRRESAMSRWDTPGVPHKDWSCTGIVDLREEDPSADLATCEMCGRESIRYVHTMKHSKHNGELDVGCVCAEKMSVGYDGKGAERNLRNRAARRSTFVFSGWKLVKSGKGHQWKKKDGVYILVGQSQYGFFAKVRDDFLPGKFVTLEAAKTAAFDVLDPK